MRLSFVLAMSLAATPAVASDNWSEREICRAATKVYFFLSQLPRDASDDGSYMGFRSATGNLYTCRVDGEVADFRWINKSGQAMSSRVTSFEVNGSTLRVQSDLKSETFQTE